MATNAISVALESEVQIQYKVLADSRKALRNL
jgi:hypothetical protein